MPTDENAEVLASLAETERLVTRLEKMCCAPGRSPSMQRLADTLAQARTTLEAQDSTVPVEETIGILEDAGAQLGRLQVGCCAPARMPLYAGALDKLTDMQLSIKRSAGVGH